MRPLPRSTVPARAIGVAALAILTLGSSGCRAQDARPAAGAGTAAPLPITDDSLAAAVGEYADRLGRAGFSGVLLVERAGQVLHARGEGLADRETGRPFTTATVWSMGSITKPFTATAILRLVERGRLSLADSLGRFIDDLPPDRAGITLEHLLTHHAGLAPPNEGDFTPVDRDRIEAIARETDLLSDPGTEYRYSNLGYSLLGVVIEKVTGESYETHLRRELLIPAGMYETGYVRPRWDPSRLATGYSRGDRFGTLIERMPPDGPYWVLRANGGLHTTAFDMLRWVRASLRGEVFGPDLAARLRTPHVSRGFEGREVGLAWPIDTSREGAPALGHDGSNGIFYADIRYFPEQDLVLLAASNVAELDAGLVLSTLQRLAFGEPVALPPRIEPVALGERVRAAMSGRWRVGEEGHLDVSWNGEHLELAVEGQGLIDRFLPLEPHEPALFRDLDARADAAIRSAGEDDAAGAADALGEAEPVDWLGEHIRALGRERGAYRGFEILGTAPVWYTSPYATWVRLDYERGSLIRRIHWSADGAYVALGGQVYPAPLTLPCVGAGSRQCAGFHLVLPAREARVTLDGEALEIRIGGEVLRASRAGTGR